MACQFGLRGGFLKENNEKYAKSGNLERMSQVEGQNDNAGTILRLTDTLLNPSFQTWLCEDEYITENQKILTRVFHLFSSNHYNILKGPPPRHCHPVIIRTPPPLFVPADGGGRTHYL